MQRAVACVFRFLWTLLLVAFNPFIQWKKAALNTHLLLIWCLGVLVVTDLYLVSIL